MSFILNKLVLYHKEKLVDTNNNLSIILIVVATKLCIYKLLKLLSVNFIVS